MSQSIYSSTLYYTSVKWWYHQDMKIPKLCLEYETFNTKELFIGLTAKYKKPSYETTSL